MTANNSNALNDSNNLKLIIATRKSKLAMWQANYIQDILQKKYPNMSVEILGLSTKGDETQAQNISLSKIGGKGLFTKELEDAMLIGDASLAVHSLKDVPMSLPNINGQDFVLAAILSREDVTDAFISNKYKNLDDLPKNAIIGTSSLRRTSILKRLYPNLDIRMLRGNIDTRLAKLDNNEYDAIILASAGLKRLGLGHKITQSIPTHIMLPSAGQGSLAIEVYGNKYFAIINELNDIKTQLASIAERKVSELLGGSCQVPLSAYAYWLNDNELDILCLESWVLSVDGKECIKSKISAKVDSIEDAQSLGNKVSKLLIEQGAYEILNNI
jgi:hydroxymethylbilane synthase